MNKLAKRNGIEVVKTYSESMSAKAPGRPLFNEMITRIQKGDASGIICWKLDRLARNPVDGGQVQWMLQKGLIQYVQTPEREYKTGDNVLMMGIELGMANQFVIDLSNNVKRGNRAKIASGFPTTLPPIGYINDVLNKTVIQDPERASMVRRMWDLLLTGNYNVSLIQRIANNDWGFKTIKRKRSGGKQLGANTLHKVFRNPFYYGYFISNGELHKGEYEPIITKEEFDKAQHILDHYGHPRPITHEFAFTGIITCGVCGGQITAEEKSKYYKGTNRVAKYVYYRCTRKIKDTPCVQPAITLQDLEQQFDSILAKLEISEEFKDWALKYLSEYNDKEIDVRTDIYTNLQNTYNAKQKEIDSLTQMRYRELITDEEYAQQKNLLLEELNKLKTKLSTTESRAIDWLELTEKTFEFARYARYWFKEGDIQKKREIARLVGSNFTLVDKKLTFQSQKPLQYIAERSDDSTWLGRRDSNPRMPVPKTGALPLGDSPM